MTRQNGRCFCQFPSCLGESEYSAFRSGPWNPTTSSSLCLWSVGWICPGLRPVDIAHSPGVFASMNLCLYFLLSLQKPPWGCSRSSGSVVRCLDYSLGTTRVSDSSERILCVFSQDSNDPNWSILTPFSDLTWFIISRLDTAIPYYELEFGTCRNSVSCDSLSVDRLPAALSVMDVSTMLEVLVFATMNLFSLVLAAA